MENGSADRNGPGNNRLHLNFAGNNDRFQQNDRAYPTTPSTFPQPVFQQGQTQQNPLQQYAPAPFTPQGYFMNNPYPPQSPQQPASSQYQTQQFAAPNAYSPRNNDPTTGLAQQLSHQNLGAAGRASPQPLRSGSQRPRTAGDTRQHQQGGYNSYMNAPMPNLAPQQHLPEFQPIPERNPDKYGPLTRNNEKKCGQLAADFFKDSVKRARDRNVR
jgi:protein-serine/threonine kinase